MAAFMLYKKKITMVWVVVIEMEWSIKPKIFTVSPFIYKVCWPLVLVCQSCCNSTTKLGFKLWKFESSGGWKSKMEVWTGLVPSEGYWGQICSIPLIASEGLLVIFGVPWLMEALPWSLLSLVFCSWMSVSMSKFPIFYNTSHMWVGP